MVSVLNQAPHTVKSCGVFICKRKDRRGWATAFCYTQDWGMLILSHFPEENKKTLAKANVLMLEFGYVKNL